MITYPRKKAPLILSFWSRVHSTLGPSLSSLSNVSNDSKPHPLLSHELYGEVEVDSEHVVGDEAGEHQDGDMDSSQQYPRERTEHLKERCQV